MPPSKRGGTTVKVAFSRFPMTIDVAPTVPADVDVVNGSVRRQHSKAESLLLFATMAVASRNVCSDIGRLVGPGSEVIGREVAGREAGGSMELRRMEDGRIGASEISGAESCAKAGALPANKRATYCCVERILREVRCFTRAV